MIMSSDWCSPSSPPPLLLPPSFSSFLCVLSLLFTPPPPSFLPPSLTLHHLTYLCLYLRLSGCSSSSSSDPLLCLSSSFITPSFIHIVPVWITSSTFSYSLHRINISPRLSSSSWSEKHTWRREAAETAELSIRVKCFILSRRGLAKRTSWSWA